MEHIGQKIKSLRKKADLTQDRLAEMLGVSAQAVSKWEVGSASPDLSLIVPLTRVFGVTADELLGIAHEKDPREIETEEALDRIMKTPGKDGKIDIRSLREKSAEAVKLYPDNLRIAYDYAVSLRFRAADPADGDEESKRERKRTAEEILKKIIRESDDAELKKEAYGTLVLMLAQGGRKKEALALAEEGACKDRLRFMCLEGQAVRSPGSVRAFEFLRRRLCPDPGRGVQKRDPGRMGGHSPRRDPGRELRDVLHVLRRLPRRKGGSADKRGKI